MTATYLAQSAYGAASAPARTTRGTEYAVFEKITARLKRAAETNASMSLIAEAIYDNRRLWTMLATDIASPHNGLPQDLRARLFYLAEFTDLHSRKILKGEGAVAPLIEINRAVMAGLTTNAASSAASSRPNDQAVEVAL